MNQINQNLKTNKLLSPCGISNGCIQTIFEDILNKQDRIITRTHYNFIDIYKVELYTSQHFYTKIATYNLNTNILSFFPVYSHAECTELETNINSLFSKYPEFFKLNSYYQLSNHSSSESAWNFLSFSDDKGIPLFIYKGNEVIHLDANNGYLYVDTLVYTNTFKQLLTLVFLLLTEIKTREGVIFEIDRDIKLFSEHIRYKQSRVENYSHDWKKIVEPVNLKPSYYCVVKITNGKITTTRFFIHKPYANLSINLKTVSRHSEFMRSHFKNLSKNQYQWLGKNKKGSKNSVLRVIKLDNELITHEWNSNEIKILSKISQLTKSV